MCKGIQMKRFSGFLFILLNALSVFRGGEGRSHGPEGLEQDAQLAEIHRSELPERGKKEAAAQALEVYAGLTDASDRSAFLEQFESSGGGKTAVSLKFATTFKGSIASNKTVGFEVEDNFFNRR